MSLAQIEYFVAVAEAGAVSRAAIRLAVSQPPLTRQIRMLEEELGTALFKRSRHGMTLLPAGRQFMVHAQRVLSELELARSNLRGVPIGDGREQPDPSPPRHTPKNKTGLN